MKGRPPLDEADRRSQILQTRVTPKERELVEAGAEAAGASPAEFIREAALDRASKALKKPRKRS